jgi:hypothetical protein
MKHIYILTQHLPNAMILGLVMLFVAASCGLGVVCFRQEITHLSHHNQLLERTLADAQRKHQGLVAKVAQVQKPQSLERLAGCDLHPVSAQQIVWVGDSPFLKKGIRIASTQPNSTKNPLPGDSVSKNLMISFDLKSYTKKA